MKIILGDCYHDSDKGGGGIMSGAISLIQSVCAKHGIAPEITLLFRFSADDPRFASAARLTTQLFPEVKVVPAPLSTRHGPHLFWVVWFVHLLTALLRLAAPRVTPTPTVRAIEEADILILKGGHFYRSWSKHALLDVIAVGLLSYTILLAKRLGKPVCVMSHSFGPFKTKAAGAFMASILRRVDYVSCREEISKRILAECGLSPEAINVTPDLGFAAFGRESQRLRDLMTRHRLTPGAYATVTTRPWFFDRAQTEKSALREQYFNGMAALCDYLADERGLTVVLVVQNDGLHSRNEPDLPPLEEIRARMRSRAAVLITEDLNAAELVWLYTHACLTLGTRLHSCIFSFTGGTPCVAVGYTHKADGIMQMMGANEFVIDIASFDVAAGKRMIDAIIAEREGLVARYTARVGELQNALFKAFEHCITVKGLAR